MGCRGRPSWDCTRSIIRSLEEKPKVGKGINQDSLERNKHRRVNTGIKGADHMLTGCSMPIQPCPASDHCNLSL